MKRIFIPLILSLVIFSTGCWTHKELDALGIITAFGVDCINEDGQMKYKITVEVAKPSPPSGGAGASGGGGGGGSATNSKVYLAEAEGVNIFQVYRQFTFQLSRRLYLPHNHVLVIGMNCAKSGIYPILDFFLRDHEDRKQEQVIISKSSPSLILSASNGLEQTMGDNLEKAVRISEDVTSETVSVTLIDLTKSLYSKAEGAVIPIVENFNYNGENRFRISGTAVFKKDRIVGELTPIETRGFKWVTGKVKSGIVVLKDKKGKPFVGMEIFEEHSSIKPELKDGEITMRIDIFVESALAESNTSEDLTTPEGIKKLNGMMEKAIEDEIMRSFRKAKKYNSDIFHFGDAIDRRYPQEWKKLEKVWDKDFRKVKLDIHIKNETFMTGELIKQIRPK